MTDLGKLCIGGDWACAHGDFSGLRHVVRSLGVHVPAALAPELAELVAACGRDPERASVLWAHLKRELVAA